MEIVVQPDELLVSLSMLPSLFAAGERGHAWSVPRAAAYGAAVGLVAAMFKMLGPLHTAGSTALGIEEIAGAMLAFALLCAGGALVRNAIARRYIWPGMR
jgi:hypothetical protein